VYNVILISLTGCSCNHLSVLLAVHISYMLNHCHRAQFTNLTKTVCLCLVSRLFSVQDFTAVFFLLPFCQLSRFFCYSQSIMSSWM